MMITKPNKNTAISHNPEWYPKDDKEFKGKILEWGTSCHKWNVWLIVWWVLSTMILIKQYINERNISFIIAVIIYIIFILYALYCNFTTPEEFYVNKKVYNLYTYMPKGTVLYLIFAIIFLIILWPHSPISQYIEKLHYTVRIIINALIWTLYLSIELYIRFCFKNAKKEFESGDKNIMRIDEDDTIKPGK